MNYTNQYRGAAIALSVMVALTFAPAPSASACTNNCYPCTPFAYEASGGGGGDFLGDGNCYNGDDCRECTDPLVADASVDLQKIIDQVTAAEVGEALSEYGHLFVIAPERSLLVVMSEGCGSVIAVVPISPAHSRLLKERGVRTFDELVITSPEAETTGETDGMFT